MGSPKKAADARHGNYGAHFISSLKGFANTGTAAQLPRMWGIFQRHTELKTLRFELRKDMEVFARRNHITLDRGIHFNKNFFDEVTAGRFNPGGAVAVYESAGQGISPLVCLPAGENAAELARADEAVDDDDNVHETREEKKQRKKTQTRLPPPALLRASRDDWCICDFAACAIWTFVSTGEGRDGSV